MRFSLRGHDAVWYYQDRTHSHVLVDPDALGRSQTPGFVRPVELWGARQWLQPPNAPVVRYAQLFGSLVALEDDGEPAPLPGGHVVDRAHVVDFVGGPNFQLGALGLLMDAVAAAVAGGPPVVLVAPNVKAGVRWIGLVSFLMPPPVSLRISFSSYERLTDVLARAEAEAGGEGDLISAALQEDDPEGWRTPVVSVIVESDLDSALTLPRGRHLPVVIVDPRVEATLVASGGPAHRRTHLGQSVRVTDWSRLALDAVCEEPGALERCLRRLDEISLATPPTGGPRGDWWPGGSRAPGEVSPDVQGAAWFLAAAVALTPGLPLALPTATRIILRDTPLGLQLSDDLAAALASLVAATVDDADQAWSRLVAARESDPPRPALVQAAFESYLYLALEDDGWLLRQAPPLPDTIRFDPGLASRLRAPLAKLTDRLARPAGGDEGDVRHGVLLLRAIDFAHRTARLVHGPDLAAAGLELLADRAARMLASREPVVEPAGEPHGPDEQEERPSGSGWPGAPEESDEFRAGHAPGASRAFGASGVRLPRDVGGAGAASWGPAGRSRASGASGAGEPTDVGGGFGSQGASGVGGPADAGGEFGSPGALGAGESEARGESASREGSGGGGQTSVGGGFGSLGGGPGVRELKDVGGAPASQGASGSGDPGARAAESVRKPVNPPDEPVAEGASRGWWNIRGPRGAWGGFAAGKPANSNGEASAAGETDVPSSIQPDEAVGLGARIAELTGPLDPAALSRWIIPHLAEAGYEPGGWLHSEAPAGERLPAAVLNLVAPAVDADRLARLRPEELAAADQGAGPDRVMLEVAVASALGRISGDPRLRGPAIRHMLRMAVDANPDADPEPLVAAIFGRLTAGAPWSASLLLQITEPAPEKLAPHLVPVALRHLGDWLDDVDSARLAAALLKRIDFLPLRDAEGRERPRRAGVTDAQAQLLNLLAITGPGWPEQDDGLHRRAAELLMFADRAWPGLSNTERRLIAPRVTVAAFTVAIAAEPAQRDTVLRSRLPVVPVGSAWREAVPLGLEAALPLVGGMLRQNKHRLAGEVVIASTRAMLRPGELSPQALPDTGADVPRLPALPVGPVLRRLVESESTFPADPFGVAASPAAGDPAARLAGHLAALVEAEIRAALGPVDRRGLREFWEQALPGAELAADPFPLAADEPEVVGEERDLRTRLRAFGGYLGSSSRPAQQPELPSAPTPVRTPPHGLAPEEGAAAERVIEGEVVQEDEGSARADAELRRPRGAQRAVNRPGWQTWLRSVLRRD
ncbi:hypothetical protein LWF15_34055 [Kineosporia rhizophila]|uniref:GAP1-M domain-containing protein n=1 Tax=Kineosporia rhizophila TaxID=84633 RepID=UPI001E4CECE1|nr:hypothetical protein [Kineosporia rhizophila]MCE0540531.1 hypothetical protein [Kineosporia rhizophila]